ncbi:Pectate lyase plyB [Fusarium oxysporum f. sp. albedinis]|nr:Pectate lyase plyB [Fusarium oxysporum f. sp. albedinis]
MLVDVEWRSEPLHPGQARSGAQLTLLFAAIIVGVVQCVSPVVRGTAVSFGSPHDQHGDHVIGPAAYMILVVGRSSVVTIDTLKVSIAGLRIVMTLLRN